MKEEKDKKLNERDEHRPLMDNKDEKKICPYCKDVLWLHTDGVYYCVQCQIPIHKSDHPSVYGIIHNGFACMNRNLDSRSRRKEITVYKFENMIYTRLLYRVKFAIRNKIINEY